MYGYLPDDFNSRGVCFALMTVISTLHNLSRSLGTAMIAAGAGQTVLLYFVAGEMLFYLQYKIMRHDFYWWPRVSGVRAVVFGFFVRIIVKIIVDYSGCLHFRHP